MKQKPPTADELAARVEALKRPPHAEPWMPAVRGTQQFLLLDDISLAALAEGIVLLRVRRQAELAARYILSP